MSTWKSNKIKAEIDCGYNYEEIDFWWEYQTTADIFSFNREYINNNSYNKKEEIGKPIFNEYLLGNDEALILFQALANWIKVYEGEEILKNLLENNIFDKDN